MHFRKVCVCGVLITQCRCMDPGKTTITVQPCVHQPPGPEDDEAKGQES